MTEAPSPPTEAPAAAPWEPGLEQFIKEAPNEPPGETNAPPEGSRFKTIRDRGRGLFAKWGLRGPGRPPNCKACGLPETKCECANQPGPGSTPESILGSAPPGPAVAAVPRDPLIIRRSIAAIGRAARKFADKVIYNKAFVVTEDKQYSEDLVKQTSASEEECEALGEVTDILLKELGLDTKYVPLAAALTIVAGAGARYWMVNKSLDRQLAEKKKGAKP